MTVMREWREWLNPKDILKYKYAYLFGMVMHSNAYYILNIVHVFSN